MPSDNEDDRFRENRPARLLPLKGSHAAERDRRHAARQHYREAPAYRIQFGLDGTVFLGQKCYEYWPDRSIEDATDWRIISRHTDLEGAERHIRMITGAAIYYDEEGRVVRGPSTVLPRWEPPPDDDD